jgi:uncharacterized protein YndB with AHSA1/START domain
MPKETKTPSKGKKQTKGTTKELVLTRVFDAPRERVWKAWTNPAEVKRWWGPKTFTTPVAEIDLRIGGKYVSAMRAPDGKEYWSTGVYREIVPLRKLVLTDSFADPKGNVVPATYYGMSAEIPREMLITVTFEDLGGKTKMTLRHAGLPAGPDREGADQGWSESFDKLDAVLAKGSPETSFAVSKATRQVTMSRLFDAPRKRVFEAYTDPKLIPKWWGPRSQTTTVETMDVRVGGRWRYVSRESDGKEFAFRGTFLEIVPPERLVSTFEYEGMPGHVSQDTATFEDLGRQTKVTVTTRFDSLEDLEGMLASGMEFGAKESWDRLAELLEER